jgi:hypothetical protein
MNATHQTAALGKQAQALAETLHQRFPVLAPVLIQFKEGQKQPTPGTVYGHRVEVDADSAGAQVRMFIGVEYESRRRKGCKDHRYVDIARVQLQHPDGSDHTTA